MVGQSQSHETTLTWVMKFSFTLVYNVLCFTRYTCKLQPFFSDVHVRYMYDQNFLLLDQDGVLVGNTVYVLSREKNCLQLCINIGILSITHFTCILSQTFDANRAESCLCLKASSSYSTSLNIRKIKKIKT